MQSYRTYLTITDSKEIILTDLPYRPGQHVEVIPLAADEERVAEVAKLYELFRQTQAISGEYGVDEDVVCKEIAAYWSGSGS